MVRHVLGISGGKDSAALAIYMKDKYPTLMLSIIIQTLGVNWLKLNCSLSGLNPTLAVLNASVPLKAVRNQLPLSIFLRPLATSCPHRSPDGALRK